MRSFLPPNPTLKDLEIARKQAMMVALTQACSENFAETQEWILHGDLETGRKLREYAEVLADDLEGRCAVRVDWSQPISLRMMGLMSQHASCARPPIEAAYLSRLRTYPDYEWVEDGLTIRVTAPKSFPKLSVVVSYPKHFGGDMEVEDWLRDSHSGLYLGMSVTIPGQPDAPPSAETFPGGGVFSFGLENLSNVAAKKMATIFGACKVSRFDSWSRGVGQVRSWKDAWHLIHYDFEDEAIWLNARDIAEEMI